VSIGPEAPAVFAFDDPFGTSADPARYVARPSTEGVLLDLVTALRDEERPRLLVGEAGMGKTLVLRLLAQRLAPRIRSVYLPYPALPLAALCAWALEELGAASSYDPPEALATLARRARADGGGIVLLVDEAQALPEETARGLAELAAEYEGALRFAAALPPSASEALFEAFARVEQLGLLAPMTESETARYVQLHLHGAPLPAAVREAFTPAVLAAIHARTGGVPSRVNAEASALLRGAMAKLRSEARAAERERAAIAVRRAAPVASAEAEAVALEHAAGRLALAHQRELGSDQVDPAFERAVGRLSLAQLEAGAPAADPAADPAAQSGPVARVDPAPRPSAAGGRRLSAAAGVFGVFFATGVGAGLWMSRRDSGPAEPAAAPVPAVSAAPAAPPAEAPTPAPAAQDLVGVQINAEPWATIRVDGQEVGVTPLAGVRLTRGPHRFEAVFPDGRTETRDVEIDDARRFLVFR
jgi:type II secretory pathway predicted ATPase ExeA